MMPAVLSRSVSLLEARLLDLEGRLEADAAAWPNYLATLNALLGVLDRQRPEAGGGLLTTKELAERLHVAPKTVLAMRKSGKLQPARVLGKRGRAAIRWRADEVAR